MAHSSKQNSSDVSSSRSRVVAELQDRLRKAESVLRSLHEAKIEADRQAERFNRTDAMKAVTGSSAIERAIAATTRMIERLKREVNEARTVLTTIDTARMSSGRLDSGQLSLVG